MKAKLEKIHKITRDYCGITFLKSGYIIEGFKESSIFTLDHKEIYSGDSEKEGVRSLESLTKLEQKIDPYEHESLKSIVRRQTVTTSSGYSYSEIADIVVSRRDDKILAHFDPSIASDLQDIDVSPLKEHYMTMTTKIFKDGKELLKGFIIGQKDIVSTYKIFDAKGKLLTQFELSGETAPIIAQGTHVKYDELPEVILRDDGYKFRYAHKSECFDFSGKAVDCLKSDEQVFFDKGRYYAIETYSGKGYDPFTSGKVQVYSSKTDELVFEFPGLLSQSLGFGLAGVGQRLYIEEGILALKKDKDTLEMYRITE